MRSRKGVAVFICLVWMSPALAGCGSPAESAAARRGALDRTAWLGSSRGWGLLGFARSGGALTYRRAENLEAPTWAPPELPRLAHMWPGEGVVWLRFQDGRFGRYDYSNGHLLTFEGYDAADVAVALDDGEGLITAPGRGTLERVAEAEAWRYQLSGELSRLESAGDGRILAVVKQAEGTELLVLEPPQTETVGQRTIGRLQDLAVAPWGGRLYYVLGEPSDSQLHVLTLPELTAAGALELSGSGSAVAVTPSGHRIYVASAEGLQVFDRLRQRPIRGVALSAPATALRFSQNGTHLLARLEGSDEVAVLQVGVDSLLGVVPSMWSERLPAVLPGGRLIASPNGELILYDLPRLVEISRADVGDGRLWLAVNWQPPRPRMNLAERSTSRATSPGGGASEPEDMEVVDPTMGATAPPGFYAVVAAAREVEGVDNLVTWLRGVGYTARIDRYEDVMGAVWYRAMVGPFSGRDTAQGAARSLSARYGYKPWILSIEDSVEVSGDSVGIRPESGTTGDSNAESG